MTVPWYVVRNVEQIPSPALFVHPPRVQENIARMVRIAGEPARLWPHVKTHKLPQVVALYQAAGIQQFKAATLAEAAMVAGCGAAAVLVAYPLVGPQVAGFVKLSKKFPATQVLAVVDCDAGLDALASELTAQGTSAEVMLDVDVGMGRTGILPGEAAVALYRRMCDVPSVRPGGLHLYDGHIRDEDPTARATHLAEAWKPVDALLTDLRSKNCPVPRLICGGSPTFAQHAAFADRLCSPGTTAFWDWGYGNRYPDLPFEPAAVLMTRVISKPAKNRICLDLGYKAVAADPPEPRVHLLELPDAWSVMHSEEHLVVETSRAEELAIGQALYAVPRHICPTVALHPAVWVVEAGAVVEQWPITARDRTF